MNARRGSLVRGHRDGTSSQVSGSALRQNPCARGRLSGWTGTVGWCRSVNPKVEGSSPSPGANGQPETLMWQGFPASLCSRLTSGGFGPDSSPISIWMGTGAAQDRSRESSRSLRSEASDRWSDAQGQAGLQRWGLGSRSGKLSGPPLFLLPSREHTPRGTSDTLNPDVPGSDAQHTCLSRHLGEYLVAEALPLLDLVVDGVVDELHFERGAPRLQVLVDPLSNGVG